MSENENQFDVGGEVEELDSGTEISWEASEYIHHEKDIGWYLIFGVVTVFIMALLFLILRDVLSLIVVGLMAISLIVFANRPPRTLKYHLNDEGVGIGENKYAFDSFRSFSIVKDGAMQSIVLNPLQRLMPPITIYFPPEEGDKIVDLLSRHLPHMEYEPNFVDRFARRVRF